MRHRAGSTILIAAFAMIPTLVACQREAAHDPILMYFVQDGSGAVYLVIEPNDVIPPHAELVINFEAKGIWVSALANPDGSHTSQLFHGEVGDVVSVSATNHDGVHWEACVLIGNFGHLPEPCP